MDATSNACKGGCKVSISISEPDCGSNFVVEDPARDASAQDRATKAGASALLDWK
jgi:hypothetical protein